MSERLKILPRWIVFVLDLFIVVSAVLLSRFIRHNFYLEPVLHNIKFVVGAVVLINSVLFLIFKSYAGIVRYTTIRDAYRILAISFLASIIYIGVSYGLYSKGPLFISRATILINFFVVSSGLIGYRMIVRHLFRMFFNHGLTKNRTKVVVYNAGEQGILTKRVINDFPQSHMQVVAFLDENHGSPGKRMEGLPIYNLKDAAFKKLAAEQVKRIIIAQKDISSAQLNFIVDKALLYGMRIQQIPSISKWLKGNLQTEQLKDINIEDLLERDVINIKNESIRKDLKGKRILVTGAAGSIGSEIVRQVTAFEPALIILCDKAESPLHELALELSEKFPDAPFKNYIGDICDKVRMEHLFDIYSPEIVFHAAAYKHVPLMEENPSVAVLNNVLGTRLLSEISVNFGVEKFVMVSTDKAVNPTNVMGASKRIAEIFTQSLFKYLESGQGASTLNGKKSTRFITTRFGNVLGSNGSVIPRFKKQIEKGGPITVTHPDITRYFMTIPEACQLVIEAGVMGSGGEIFVFDMGKPVRVTDLAEKMIRLAGKVPNEDIKIIFTGLRPGEKLYEELLSNSENTLPTYHEKIMIAKVREYDFHSVNQKIEELISSASMHYTYETVAVMKELVPEFISNNSVFESLDSVKKQVNKNS